MSNEIKNVCVYCGSSYGTDDSYRQAAATIGRILAEQKIGLVYGGGHVGLMGATADAVLENGGKAIGIIPAHIADKEVAHEKLSELHIVHSMHERKQMMVERSDAFVVLPGGFGTMDEFFEILTWKQLGLHRKPVILLNINNYWTPLLSLLDSIISNEFARPADRDFFQVAHDPAEVGILLQTLERESEAPRSKWM